MSIIRDSILFNIVYLLIVCSRYIFYSVASSQWGFFYWP